jgi:hypothetical protein
MLQQSPGCDASACKQPQPDPTMPSPDGRVPGSDVHRMEAVKPAVTLTPEIPAQREPELTAQPSYPATVPTTDTSMLRDHPTSAKDQSNLPALTVTLYQTNAPARAEAQPTAETKPRGIKRRAAAPQGDQRTKPAEKHLSRDVPLNQPHHGGWPMKRTEKRGSTCSPEWWTRHRQLGVSTSSTRPNSAPRSRGGAPTAKVPYADWALHVGFPSTASG